MDMVKRSIRLPDALCARLITAANDDQRNVNDLIIEAVQSYLDHRAMNTPGSHLPEWQHQQTMAAIADYANKTNNTYCKLLSEIVIALNTIEPMMADRLGISEAEAREYRMQAVERTQQNNRVLRFDEVAK